MKMPVEFSKELVLRNLQFLEKFTWCKRVKVTLKNENVGWLRWYEFNIYPKNIIIILEGDTDVNTRKWANPRGCGLGSLELILQSTLKWVSTKESQKFMRKKCLKHFNNYGRVEEYEVLA